jgi:hypothetical protein
VGTFEQYTDPIVRTLTRVLPASPGVCPVCHSAPGEGFYRCRSCFEVFRAVSRPVELVVPISLCVKPSQLYRTLWGYKSAWTVSTVRRDYRLQVAALIGRFLRDHGECIQKKAGRGWDIITTVPSTRRPNEAHPLESVVQMPSNLKPLFRRVLGPGTVDISGRKADDRGFQLITKVTGMGILLLDDLYTKGARAQSAASTLQLAGAS